jgi:hypothetical protein
MNDTKKVLSMTVASTEKRGIISFIVNMEHRAVGKHSSSSGRCAAI